MSAGARRPRAAAKAKAKPAKAKPAKTKPKPAKPKPAKTKPAKTKPARRRPSAPRPLVTGTRAGPRAPATTRRDGPIRLSANPEDVERSVVQLVLTLVEFLRELMERQAIRRVDVGDLTDEQIEAVGTSLMVLEKTVHKLARRFDLRPEDLDLDLGPLGRLRGT